MVFLIDFCFQLINWFKKICLFLCLISFRLFTIFLIWLFIIDSWIPLLCLPNNLIHLIYFSLVVFINTSFIFKILYFALQVSLQLFLFGCHFLLQYLVLIWEIINLNLQSLDLFLLSLEHRLNGGSFLLLLLIWSFQFSTHICLWLLYNIL